MKTLISICFVFLSLYSVSSLANKEIPDWCSEDQYFSIDSLREKASTGVSFENAMSDYEEGESLVSLLKFRNHAVYAQSTESAYNTAFIAEEIKENSFYGGDYFSSLCQNLKSSSDFNIAYHEYKKDTDEGDKKAIETFASLSDQGNPLASYFLAKMYVYNPVSRSTDYYDQRKALEYAEASFEQGGSYSGKIIESFSGFAVENYCNPDSDSLMFFENIYDNQQSLRGISDACDAVVDVVVSYVESYENNCEKVEDICLLEKAISSGSSGLDEFCSYARHWYEVAAEAGDKGALNRIIYLYGNREEKGLFDEQKTCFSFDNGKVKHFSGLGMKYHPDDSYYIWNYGISSLDRNLSGGFNNEILGSKYLRQSILKDIENGNIDVGIERYGKMKNMGLDNMFVDMLEKDIADAL
ncbi:hypothetical protein [Halomonas halodenitrificans]|uniref:hypothetical protein n=1 Tax=Halomonas halodenitrificans TaxID=28252 RepID=UPI000A6220B9|nr:hypothetical protein [Halomonas halodenitrificans]